MTEWVSFSGQVVPLVLGRATYTILPLPDAAAATLLAAGARRVEGEIAEHPVNLALSSTAEVGGPFLWAGQSLLDRLGIKPFEEVEVRLRPATPDAVDLPDDVALALLQSGRTGSWESLTPGRRRGLLYKIATAKTEATRAKRIAAMLGELPA